MPIEGNLYANEDYKAGSFTKMYHVWSENSVREVRLQRLVNAGGGTSLPPSEALTDLAAAVLEVAASEGRPQLCIVPCFPSIGWAVLCKGEAAPPSFPSFASKMADGRCT
jgi:hypothetical protein